MPRAQRREQILEAATRAFARGGFANTGLDAIAAEAGVTPVILYRHFASKADLYREVIECGHARLCELTGAHDFDEASIPALVHAAAADPDAFRLLYRYAAREPEFRDMIADHGCPYGTLCTELANSGESHPLTAPLMQTLLDWTEQQFHAMGRRDAHDLALELVIAYQGSAVLTNALAQPELMAHEARRLEKWITALRV